MTNVDALYTLIWDLLRGNALTAFNNEQAKFENQFPENLEHCLNAVTVQVIKSNNYLAEFPTPTGIEAKKLEDEEILEILENRFPTSWKFQMNKE
eukprot:5182492-Ditylum_brightwellii.AAC.1